MRKVAVFFGGRSCENEISILTGVFVLNLLDRERYSPLPVYLHTDGGAYTSPKMFDLSVFREKKYSGFERIIFDGGAAYSLNEKRGRIKRLAKVDVAINCCHGGLGEGGGVSALAAMNGIPLASPDLTASGVFMDKGLTKLMMRALNIPTVEYLRVNERDYEKRGAFLLRSVESKLKYPVIVKPSGLGSSIGIRVAKDEEGLKEALEEAFTMDNGVIIERFLEGKEDVNCAAYALDGEIIVSEPERAFSGGVYSFEEKYVKRRGENGAPMGAKTGGGRAVTGELREKIRAYTRSVYKRLRLQGVVRMDFLAHEGKAYLCEINAVPGSLAYYLFCDRIVDAKNFFTDLLENAVKEYSEGKKRVFSTGILRSVIWRNK